MFYETNNQTRMLKKVSFFLSLTLLIPISACERPLFWQRESHSPEEILSLIETRFAEVEAANTFHGGVLIALDGNPIFHEAYGESGRGIVNTPAANFNIASMGKMFTGVCIMKYIEEGKLSLDQTIGDFLPDYANKTVAQSVNIHHLLTHTSGIPDIFSFDNIQKIDQSTINTWHDYFPYFESSELEFKAGKKFSYSNSAYVVLGAILEAVAAKNYCEVLKESVFDPSSMNDALCGGPLGGSEVSLLDMLRFTQALLDAQLLSSENTDLATTGKVKIARKAFYAYGFQEEFKFHSREISHKGGDLEIKSQTLMFPQTGYTLIIYANNNDIGYETFDELRAYLGDLLS